MIENTYSTLSIIGKDSTVIPYRRELAILTGTVHSAILLTQILYWADKMNYKPFFKYKEPPQQKDDETKKEYLERVSPYKEGDSWTEELYFTKEEFDSALQRIAHNKNKKLKDDNRKLTDEEKELEKREALLYPIKQCIHYWTTRERKTYYEIKKPELLSKVVGAIFVNKNLQFRKTKNSNLDIIQRLLTEITQIQSKDCITASQKRCSEKGENFIDQDDTLGFSQDSSEQKPIIKKSLGPNQSRAAILRNKAQAHSNTPKPAKPDYVCPKVNQPFVDAWCELTGKRYLRKNTTTYRNDCIAIGKLRNGTFFNKKDTPTVDSKYYECLITLKEWRDLVTTFAIMRNNADYFPKNKKNIKLLTIKPFLYNEMSPSAMKSYFISCIETKPKLLSPQLKDPDPDYTDYVIQACKRVFGWDLGNGGRATAIKCANRLSKFFADNKHKINMYNIHYRFTNQQVDELLTMLEKNESPDYPAKPEYLYGALTYDKLLPEHLDNVGSLIQ